MRPFRALRYDPGGRGPARRPRRAARTTSSRTRQRARVPRAQPVQRRPSDAARLRGAGRRATSPPGARSGVLAEAARDATGGSRRTTSAPTASPRTREGLRRVRPGDAVRGRRGPAARAHARRPEGRVDSASCARRGRSSSRSSCSTTPSRCSSGPRGEPAAGRRGGRRAHAGLAGRGGRAPSSTTPLLIADGHHRYETAVAYRAGESRRDAHLRRSSSRRARPGSRSSRRHRLVQGGR